MLKDWKFWTLIVAIIGILGGIPGICNFFRKSKLEGKIISRYNNINPNMKKSLLLFKLSLFSKNKPFNIKQISCQIEDVEGKKSYAAAFNSRLTVFVNKEIDKLLPSGEINFIEKKQRLLISEDKFLNNYSFFPAEKNITGYLLFKFDCILEQKWKTTTFIFESFDKKIQRIKFQESILKKEALFYDDSIWEDYKK